MANDDSNLDPDDGQRREDPILAEAEPEADSDEPEEDDLLLVESDDYDDDHGGGLEVDDQQAREVESIFLTTLPQYLEPVEEMVDQLMSAGDDASGEVQNALVATVTALAAAAERMGIDDVFARLDALARRVGELDLTSGSAPSAEQRESVYAALRDIGELVKGERSDEGDRESAQTVFAALGSMTGIDDSVLSRLTAAGVVYVDQLLMADPDEIVAVSGLTPKVVTNILAALRADADGGVAGPDADSPDGVLASTDVDPAPAPATAQNVLEFPLGEAALRAQLEQRLRAQVEAEMAVEEAEAELRRLRAHTDDLRAQLRRAEQRRDTRLQELEQAGRQLADSIAERSRLRARRGQLALEISAAQEARRGEERRISDLKRQQEVALADRVRLDRQVGGLAARVRRLLETAHGR